MSDDPNRPELPALPGAAPPEDTQPGTSAPPSGEAAPAPEGPKPNDGRNWAAMAHLSAFLGYASIPFGFLLGPLIVWAALKDKYALVDDQGKEALNFQLSVLIYTLASIPLICLCIGLTLLILISLMNFIFIIVAAVRAANGERYRYPLTIRFLK